MVVLVNGEGGGNMTHGALAGGMQWYVDQVLGNASYGSGGSYNLFYTDPAVKQVLDFAAQHSFLLFTCFICFVTSCRPRNQAPLLECMQ